MGNKFHFSKNNLTLDWTNPTEKEVIKSKIPRLKRKWLAIYCKHRPYEKICAKRKQIRLIMAEEIKKYDNHSYDSNPPMKMSSTETSWWEGYVVNIIS